MENKKYIVLLEYVTRGLKAASNSLYTTDQSTKRLSTTTQKATGIQQDFTKALRRVAIVVPIWMAFRAVLQTVTSLLREGAKLMEDFDNAITKSRAVIHTESQSMEGAIKALKDTVLSLSIDTGERMDELTSSFYRFGTVGIGFEDSMGGMKASAKTALAMFGDVDEIGSTLALTYKLLGDTLEENIPTMDKQVLMGAKLFTLWKNNAFEINGMNQALMNFLPTANTANFTYDQTISLLGALSTGAVQNARGGRLLRTSVGKLVQNMDKLATSLGVKVNPELSNTFDVLLLVLGKIKELEATEGIPTEAIESIREIFGGVRGGEPIKALASVLELLKGNLEAIKAGNYDQVMSQFNNRIQEVNESVGRQIKRFRNLKEILGKAYVSAIVGGDDFADSMIKINKILEQLIANSHTFQTRFQIALTAIMVAFTTMNPLLVAFVAVMGQAIVGLDEQVEHYKKLNKQLGTFNTQLERASKGKLPREELDKFLVTLEKISKDNALQKQFFNGKQGAKELTQLMSSLEVIYKRVQDTAVDSTNELTGANQKLSLELKNQINSWKNQSDAIQDTSTNASKIQSAYKKIELTVKNLVQQHNNLRDENGKLIDQVDERTVLTLAISKEYEQIVELLGTQLGTSENLKSINGDILALEKARRDEVADANKQIASHVLEMFRLQGATNVQIAKATIELENQLGVNQDFNSQLAKQLKLSQEITKERTDQYSLSSNSLKLYEIAQREGISVARDIGQALANPEYFKSLIKSGRDSSQILQNEFADLVKIMEARTFLFEGRGQEIPISERGVTGFPQIQALAQNIKESLIGLKITPNFPVTLTFPAIKISVDDTSQIASRVVNQVIKQIKQKESDIAKAIDSRIEEF